MDMGKRGYRQRQRWRWARSLTLTESSIWVLTECPSRPSNPKSGNVTGSSYISNFVSIYRTTWTPWWHCKRR